MTNHQFCQFCKDCSIPTKFFPLPLIDQVYNEACAAASTAELSLVSFMTVVVKLAHLRYPEVPDLFIKVSSLLNDKIMPHAKASTKDQFRVVLYQPQAQAMLMKHRNKIEVVFKHYAATDLDSTPDAFTKTNTINLREFTLFLRECGFVKSEEDHR